jgi:hypothetical protein
MPVTSSNKSVSSYCSSLKWITRSSYKSILGTDRVSSYLNPDGGWGNDDRKSSEKAIRLQQRGVSERYRVMSPPSVPGDSTVPASFSLEPLVSGTRHGASHQPYSAMPKA